jgi:predicted metal-dependent hydrolase
MVRNGGKENDRLEHEIDALFTLPLAEFTGARNMLAARLKKEGRANDAERVKLLSKPSISAWTVNQLFWDHRDAFDELIASGKRLRPAQTSRPGGKAAGMRDSLDARREALIHLSELATEVLTGAGHNPTPDTMRRIVTTLEAITAYALLPDGPTAGRLTGDVDPPSFESLASLMSRSRSAEEKDVREPPAPPRKSVAAGTSARQRVSTPGEVRRIEEFRQAKIASAKARLQEAKKSLADARTRVQTLETSQKKTNAELKEAEKRKRQAESLLEQATAAYDDAAERAESLDADVREAANAIEDAKRRVEEETQNLELLLRGSPR